MKKEELLKQIEQLKQQLEEKDKEIAHLKDAVNMCQSIKRYDIGEMLIENATLEQSQTQLAIQELEKVRDYFIMEDEQGNLDIIEDIYDVANFINQQIKVLKGLKD